jgi:hypothetical protein
LKKIENPYFDLYRLSKKARYLCQEIKSKDVMDAQDDLREIQKYICGIMPK